MDNDQKLIFEAYIKESSWWDKNKPADLEDQRGRLLNADPMAPMETGTEVDDAINHFIGLNEKAQKNLRDSLDVFVQVIKDDLDVASEKNQLLKNIPHDRIRSIVLNMLTR